MFPAVRNLLAETLTIRVIQLGHGFEVAWVPCHQGALLKKRKNVIEVVFADIPVHVLEEFVF